MSEQRGYYNFEDFPRGRLAFQVPRRLFLGTLLTEVLVASGEGRGGEGYKLAELGEWADADLALLIPGIANGCEISVEAGFVCGRLPNRRRSTRLFPVESHALSVFNQFDGQTPLGEAAACLARETECDLASSFAYTRGVFLWLVLAGVCLPKGSESGN
ncbi:MAG TPA: hypothetical protein VJ436_00505 [Anaerolineales bacterium]|nr:hypothetical protein [Anaerolineales bacterium]